MKIKLKNSTFFYYINQLIFRFKDDEITGTGAQITYYLILSFFPFLLFVINMLSFTSLSEDVLFANFSTFLPRETGDLLKKIVLQTIQAKSTLLLITGMVAALWSSSKGIAAVIRGINKAYGIKENRSFIKRRAISIVSAVAFSLLIIIALFTLVFGEVIAKFLFDLVGAQSIFPFIWSALRYAAPILIMFISLSLLYKFLPNRKLKFKDIRLGAVFATVAWIVASLLFSFYVNNFARYNKIYGSIGGIMALLIWLFFSTLIILVGGELNAIYIHKKSGRPIKKYDSFRLELFDRFGWYD